MNESSSARRSRLLVAVISTVAVLVMACGSPSTSSAPSSPSGTGPATTSLATAAPGTSTAPEPSSPTETSGEPTVEPSSEATPLPTPVVVDPGDVPAGATVIRWYCCLGTGDSPENVEVEKAVIEQWNSTHEDIKIAGEFVLYAQAYDTLAAEVASGNPPDIVGPVGYGGANAFPDQWLDLQPLIESTNYDTSQW